MMGAGIPPVIVKTLFYLHSQISVQHCTNNLYPTLTTALTRHRVVSARQEINNTNKT